MNAVVHVAPAVIDETKKLDELLAQGGLKGKLHGVPITVKDTIDVAGLPTTAGVAAWKDRQAQSDATVVSRLKGEGAIVIGKTNVPLFAVALETENALQQTKNPYDLKRTPGGSSGGEAAIIAASGSPLGIGADAGASIRVPASFCGVAGLCPSYGRVSSFGTVPAGENSVGMWYQAIGPIARSVEDLALTLPIISGPDDRDPFTFDLRALESFQLEPRTLRVDYWTGDDNVQPSTDVRQAILAAALSLKELGASVEETHPPYDLETFSKMLIAVVLPGWIQLVEQLLETNEDEFLREGLKVVKQKIQNLAPAQIEALQTKLPDVRRSVMQGMEGFDAVICPVTKTPAVPLRESWKDISNFDYPGLIGTAWALPSGTVRCGTSREGLPVGVQIVGSRNREDLVLGVMRLLEQELGGWKPATI